MHSYATCGLKINRFNLQLLVLHMFSEISQYFSIISYYMTYPSEISLIGSIDGGNGTGVYVPGNSK